MPPATRDLSTLVVSSRKMMVNLDGRHSSTAKTDNRDSTEWNCVLPHRQLTILAGLVLPMSELRNSVPKAGFGNARSNSNSGAQYMRTDIFFRSAICNW